GARSPRLYAHHRVPHGIAAAGIFRQTGRQAGRARDGAPGLRRGGAVLCAADFLSLGGADHRHRLLPREPAARLSVLSQTRAQGCGRRERHAAERARTRPRRRAVALTGPWRTPARPAPSGRTPARPRPARAAQLTNVARIERSEIRGSVPHFAALNAGYISFASSFSRSRWTRGSSPRGDTWVIGPAADAPA